MFDTISKPALNQPKPRWVDMMSAIHGVFLSVSQSDVWRDELKKRLRITVSDTEIEQALRSLPVVPSRKLNVPVLCDEIIRRRKMQSQAIQMKSYSSMLREPMLRIKSASDYEEIWHIICEWVDLHGDKKDWIQLAGRLELYAREVFPDFQRPHITLRSEPEDLNDERTTNRIR